MLVVSEGLWPCSEPRSGMASSQSLLLSGDEVEEGESVLFGGLVESDEALLDVFDEVLRAMSREAADPEAFIAESIEAEAGGESSAEVVLADGRTFDRYTGPIIDPHGENLGRAVRHQYRA